VATSQNPTGGSALAIAGLVITALIWGAMVPMTYVLATQYLDPFVTSGVRYLIPLPLLFVMAWAMDRASPFRAPLPWPVLAKLGFGMASFSIFYTIGVTHSEPVRAAIVMSCGPLIAALMSKVMLKLPLARGFWPAAICAVIGAALVALDAVRPRSVPADAIYWGEPLLVFAMACWSWYSIRLQTWLGPLGWSVMRATTLTSLCGAGLIFSLIVVLAAIDPSRLPHEMIPLPAFGMLIWVGVGGAAIAVVLWNNGVRHVGVPVATLYSNMAPVFAVVVSALFFGSSITLQQIGGGILILAGVVRMQWLAARSAREQAAMDANRQKMV
jgi:drug/metabolite transporter (DMT)-like permease